MCGELLFTRYSKGVETRIFWLVLVITAIGAFFCPHSFADGNSQDFNLPIPSPDDPESWLGKGWMADAIIDVNKHLLIEDLDVAVSLTHEAFLDLEIILQSPAGTAIMLNPSPNYAFITRGPDGRLESAGGFNRFLFDDEAAVDIENAAPPFSQAFKPASDFKLSAFDGQDAFGQWRLQIRDARYWKTGQLEKVELIINTPEPASACLLALAVVVARLLKPRRTPQ